MRTTGEAPLLPLILASASPRRRDLLAEAGITHEVVVCALNEPTQAPPTLPPRAWAMALAYFKALDVARRHPGRWVLGADTIVICRNRILGKPGDVADARAMLELQAGVWTDVVTGVALVRVGEPEVSTARAEGPVAPAVRAGGPVSDRSLFNSILPQEKKDRSETGPPAQRSQATNSPPLRRIIGVVTRVYMRDDRAVRETYLAGGDWDGKAGAYGIQNIGDQLVDKIEGSFSNVVGLPMERVAELLRSIEV